MKTQIKNLFIVAMLVVGLGISTFASAAMNFQLPTAAAKATTLPSGLKIAVVDVNAVVAKSAQVQALKSEQQAKLAELKTWLDKVRADVKKQKTKDEQEKLIKKYDEEFVKKQEALKKNYATKLQAIDKSISQTIAERARALNYNLIFAKGSVLFGGDDITQDVIKYVK